MDTNLGRAQDSTQAIARNVRNKDDYLLVRKYWWKQKSLDLGFCHVFCWQSNVERWCLTFSSAQMPITRLLMLHERQKIHWFSWFLRKRALIIRKLTAFERFHINCYFSPHSFTDFTYAIANQNRARPKFLSTLYKSGPSPTQNLGQVFRVHTRMGQAQVFENLGRAWASLRSVDTA